MVIKEGLEVVRAPFTLVKKNVKEITYYASRAFISEFLYMKEEVDSDSDSEMESESESSDSDPLDPSFGGCGEITPSVEEFVNDNWDACDPMPEVLWANIVLVLL